jgi:predicted lysophospholipase L1 biosynthesis ABC-type transport system permease subunit
VWNDRHHGDPVAEMYVPFAQQPDSSMAFIIRTTSKPEDIIAAIRQTVQSLDKDQPVYGIRTLESVMSEAVAKPSFRTFLLGVFASVALILAMVGIYDRRRQYSHHRPAIARSLELKGRFRTLAPAYQTGGCAESSCNNIQLASFIF